MEVTKEHKLSSPFFWLSLLCHLLFLLSILYFSNYQPTQVPSQKIQKKPDKKRDKTYYYYMPAYHAAEKSAVEKNKIPLLKKIDKAFDLSQIKPKHSNPPMQSTRALKMIGEKLLDDPLRKLLGQAITENLDYPEMASELHLRGMVSIGFTLHPDGGLTGIHIVKSSHERILDIAALNAVTAASPIASVDIYLKEAKYLVVNVVF